MKSEAEEVDPDNPELEGLLHAEQQGLLQPQNGKQPLITEKLSATLKPSQPVSPRQSAVVEDDVDVVSMVIGDYGRWQLMMTFLLSLFSFPCTFHIYMPTFTLRTPEHWCKRPSYLSDVPIEDWIQYSQPKGPCWIRELPANITSQSIIDKTALVLDNITKCTAWEFNKTEMGETIISEWGLVCDREMYTTLADVLFLVGVGIGGVLGGLISDKFGRKRTLMAMALTQSVLALLALLVRTYVQYVIVRLIMGLVSVSVVYAAFVLAVEIVGGKWMTIAGVCNFFPLPLSYIIVSLVSLALPDWRDLQLSLSLPGWLLLVLWFVLPESPRWLLTMGKTQEAKKILQSAASFNKRPLPVDLDKLLLVHKSDQPPETSSITVLFKGQLLKRTVCLFIAWFGMTIGYYGMLLNIGNFGLGNLHMSSIILAAVEVPAIAISIPILLKLGRKKPIFTSFALCSAACIATVLLNLSFDSDIVMISSLMIGKFAISTTNMMLPIFTAELYPTYVRNLGVGASQLASGIALIFVPYLWYLSAIAKQLPLSTIALICFMGGLVVLLLPETCRRSQESAHPIDRIENTVTISGTITSNDDRGLH